MINYNPVVFPTTYLITYNEVSEKWEGYLNILSPRLNILFVNYLIYSSNSKDEVVKAVKDFMTFESIPTQIHVVEDQQKDEENG